MATTKKKRGSRSGEKGKAGPMPKIVYAQVSPRSIGGRSLFDAPLVTEADVADYTSEEHVRRNAVTELQNAGFDVLQVGDCTINVAAPPKLYEDFFGTRLHTEERPVLKEQTREDTATFVDTADTDVPGFLDCSTSPASQWVEGLAIEEPRYFFQNAFAPTKGYWHLRVPGDVSLGMNADRAHRSGVTGKGVKIVMTDSGWFRHPYFVQRGYRSSPVVLGPGTSNPTQDEIGHGTGESANVFAVAPDVDFTMVKLSFVNTTAGFNAAVALNPQIISNSWGSSIRRGPLSAANQALAAAIAVAVSRGIIVVFSAGNGHYGFPAQHPDVIAAGGVYMEPDGAMQASDYASGFASQIYTGRNVPDVSGLVGMRSPVPGNPGAMYIMLPVEPRDAIDRNLSGGTHYRTPGATPPFGDETANNDGWAAFSGTSAAAPQVGGVCALIRQACGRLTPAQVRDILKSTARDVTAGSCSPSTGGNPAAPGPDLATGHGLVDAHRAVMVAKLRCRPIGPVISRQPGPITRQPGPIPRQPGPIPRQPGPVLPSPESQSSGESYDLGGHLSDEERAQLEQMIIDGEIEEL